MQPVGDYLKKLLFQYDCIVVPTLGAFLTHAVSAQFSEATGQFLPPRRKVAFNEALMLDDGILLTYIMLHEGITREEAQRRINDFVTQLKQQVRSMGSFSLEGLGLFSYNVENRLQFEPELRHNFLGNTFGMQPVFLPGKVVHLAQPLAVVKSGAPARTIVRPLPVRTGAPDTAVAALAVVEDGQVLPMPVRRSGAAWRWVAAALVVGSLGFVSYFSVIRPGEPLQSSLNPAALFRMPSLSTGEASRAVTLSPVPVPAATPRPTPALPAAPVVVENPAVVPAVVVKKPEVLTKAVTRAAVATKVRQPQVKTAFTVIAGSFASRRNALRFQKRLVRAGYSDAYIVHGRGLIKVAAIGTSSLDEAVAGIDSLQSLTGIAPWIMRNH